MHQQHKRRSLHYVASCMGTRKTCVVFELSRYLICTQGGGEGGRSFRAIHASLRAQRVQRSAVHVCFARSHTSRAISHPTKQQVRGVAACDVGLLTGSRDRTVKVWAPEGAHCFTAVRTLTGNAGFVGPVAYAPPGLMPNAPNGAVISGAWS